LRRQLLPDAALIFLHLPAARHYVLVLLIIAALRDRSFCQIIALTRRDYGCSDDMLMRRHVCR